MAYRALVSFSGVLSMVKGEVREITDEAVANDLVKSGYITDLSEKQKTAKSSKSSKVKGGESAND